MQPFLQVFAAYGFEATKDPLSGAGLGSKKRQHSNYRQWLTESLMTDLAGNAMALPVLLAVLQSAVCSLDFSRASPTVQKADTAAVLQALKLLTGV